MGVAPPTPPVPPSAEVPASAVRPLSRWWWVAALALVAFVAYTPRSRLGTVTMRTDGTDDPVARGLFAAFHPGLSNRHPAWTAGWQRHSRGGSDFLAVSGLKTWWQLRVRSTQDRSEVLLPWIQEADPGSGSSFQAGFSGDGRYAYVWGEGRFADDWSGPWPFTCAVDLRERIAYRR